MFDGLTIFNGVDSEELKTLSVLMQERFIKKGNFLFKEGDDAIAIYFIKKGEIDLIKDSFSIGVIKSDSMFGEKAFLKGFTKRLMSARAKEDTILIVMLYENFKIFLNKHPSYIKKMKTHFSSYNIDSKLEK